MLIHAGTRDVGTLKPRYSRAAKRPKQIWLVPSGEHIDGIDERPIQYERSVVGFLVDALLDK